MIIPKPGNRRTFWLISLIIAGETIFFLPFVIARIFRPTLLHVFDISNTELGTFFSVYGVVAMVSYFLGGPLADRFPSRNLLSSALWLTALGGFTMWAVPFKEVLIFLYAFWGVTTILLFWAALIRTTREWGGENLQGLAFGWLEGGRGATAALLGTVTLFVFSDFDAGTLQAVNITTERISAYRNVILLTSIFTFVSGILIWFLVPDNKENRLSHNIKLNQISHLLTIPSVWLLAIIIICAYVGYKITDDFSLYANQVIGFNEVESAGVGTSALWMRALAAVLAGYMVDKIRASKLIGICFAIAALGGFLVASGILESMVLMMLLNLAVVMVGVFGLRALYFTLIHEANIPMQYTGTVVGIVSVMGFTPDIFMSPWMGILLDRNLGSEGHRYVFLVLSLFAVVGFIASLCFTLINKQRYTN
ncbi:MAG: MFS transporter [Bacteroidales bacterium]|nr:MFS transporter [Bacteroidales bacterium]